jgi:hypothetical protein
MKRILTFRQLFEATKPGDTTWMPTDAEIKELRIYQDLRRDSIISLGNSYYHLTPSQKERNVRVISFSTGTNAGYKLEPNSDGTINIKMGRGYITKNTPFRTQEEMTDVIMYLMIVSIAIYDPVWDRKSYHSPKKTPFNDDYVKLNGELERGDLEGLLNGIIELVESQFGLGEERLIGIVIILIWHLKSATQQAKDNFIKQLIVNVTAEMMFLHWCDLLKNFFTVQPFVAMPGVVEGLSIAFVDFLNGNQDSPIPTAVKDFVSRITNGFEWIVIR